MLIASWKSARVLNFTGYQQFASSAGTTPCASREGVLVVALLATALSFCVPWSTVQKGVTKTSPARVLRMGACISNCSEFDCELKVPDSNPTSTLKLFSILLLPLGVWPLVKVLYWTVNVIFWCSQWLGRFWRNIKHTSVDRLRSRVLCQNYTRQHLS